MCRRRRALSPIPIRSPNGRRRSTRRGRCCARPPLRRARPARCAHGADDRQLRFVHLQPGAVPGRARPGSAGSPQRRYHRGAGRGAVAARDRYLAGTEPARAGWHLARADLAPCGTRAAARRLPRTPGDRPGLRRQGGARTPGDARQGVARAARRPRRVPRSAVRFPGDPLPLARRRARLAARMSCHHRRIRGRRDHGAAPSQPARPGPAIPSRGPPDRARPQDAAEFHRGSKVMKQITIAEAIQRTVEHREVFHDEMLHVMRQIMRGELSPAQIAGFVVGLRVKKETIGEIAAAAQVMRELATPVEVANDRHLVDTCGTGGDAAHTFNVSTCAAFVAAAAGAKVAKHMGRSVSSSSGSAEALEALGAQINLSPAETGQARDKIGIGFMFAPAHHAAMKYAAPVRKDLGVRTIFNILGPLTNPAGAKNQVMGVFHADLVGIEVRVLHRLGSEHVMTVHGLDGLDEISVSGETLVGELVNGEINEYRLHPSQVGLELYDRRAIEVHTVEESKEMIVAVLGNQPGPARSIAALNAGAAIYVAGVAKTFKAGVEQALRAIENGEARRRLDQYMAFTK